MGRGEGEELGFICEIKKIKLKYLPGSKPGNEDVIAGVKTSKQTLD